MLGVQSRVHRSTSVNLGPDIQLVILVDGLLSRALCEKDDQSPDNGASLALVTVPSKANR